MLYLPLWMDQDCDASPFSWTSGVSFWPRQAIQKTGTSYPMKLQTSHESLLMASYLWSLLIKTLWIMRYILSFHGSTLQSFAKHMEFAPQHKQMYFSCCGKDCSRSQSKFKQMPSFWFEMGLNKLPVHEYHKKSRCLEQYWWLGHECSLWIPVVSIVLFTERIPWEMYALGIEYMIVDEECPIVICSIARVATQTAEEVVTHYQTAGAPSSHLASPQTTYIPLTMPHSLLRHSRYDKGPEIWVCGCQSLRNYGDKLGCILAQLARLRFSKNVGATFLCQRIFVIREAVRLSPSYEENGPKTTEIHFVCVVVQIPCVLQMTVVKLTSTFLLSVESS